MNDAPAVPRSDLLTFGVTIFTGAFLLFQVQPLIGKYILPWFGGTPSVWTTCLLFFQCLLLAGYGYAHLLTRLPLKKQALVHLSLLAISLLFLPIRPSEALQPVPGGNPAWQIFVLLAATIGLPYLVLSATGPLMQSWFSRKFEGRSPYRLYALSNVGSMLALVSYPFLVEPYTTRNTQVWSWSIGLMLFAIVCGTVAWNMRRVEESANESLAEKPLPKISRGALLLWLLLPACGTAQLMATTNKITQDVAIIPFLWVLPLSLYLLSFIICFDSPRWYSRTWFSRGLFLCWVGIVWALHKGADADLILQVVIFNAALFFGCMICHGELYRLRPPAVRLTQYFLVIAAGGALGGLFVALLAPLVFVDYWEFHLALWGCGALLVAVCFLNDVKWSFTRWHLRIALALCFLAAYWGLSLAFEVKYAGIENLVLVQPGVPAGAWWVLAGLLAGSLVLTWLMSLVLDAWIQSSTQVQLAAAVMGSGWMLGLFQPLLWITGGELEVASWALLAAWVFLIPIGFVWFSIGGWRGFRLSSGWTWSLLAVVLGVVLLVHAAKSQEDVVRQTRNFYGVLKIFDYGMKAGDPMHGHQGTVRVLARDLSTRSLASADDAGMIRVWDYESGRTLRVLQEHQGPVRAICFSSDGQWLVSSGADRTVRLWEVDAEREKRVMKMDVPVNAVACNPGDQWVAVGDEEGVIRILDFGSFETAATLPGHDGPVHSLEFDITSNRLLSAGQDGVIKIWDVDTRQLITEMKGHVGAVHQAAFGQNGSLVVSAGADGTARVWHASDGRLRHVLRGHAGPVLSAAIDTRDSRVATAGADGVKIWDLTDGRAICTLADGEVSRDARATLFLPPTAFTRTDLSHRLDRVVTAQGNTLHTWNLDLHQRRIRNGRITHGMQYTHPDLAKLQTTYYGPSSGVGVALGWLRPTGRTIGVVGLGSGTIAAYGKKGDHVWFYDIDPDVEKVANTHFTYLRDCERRGAEVKVVLGDARMSLKDDRVPRSKFDLLVLDAFSSDAIPAHLLTKEAIGVYQRHMSDQGIIAIHVSNRHLNLSGVVLDISREASLVPIRVSHNGEYSSFNGRAIDAFWRTDWILLARPSLLVDNLAARRLAYEHHFYFKQTLAEWVSAAGIPESRLGDTTVSELLEVLQEDSALKEQWPMIKMARKVARFARAGNQPFAGQNTAEFLRATHGHPEMRLWTDDYVSLYRILNTPDWWDDLRTRWRGWWE